MMDDVAKQLFSNHQKDDNHFVIFGEFLIFIMIYFDKDDKLL